MQLVPYLSFDGRAREAMEFYKHVFGGELNVTSLADSGAVPPGSPSADKVMHAALVTDHITIYGADWVPEFWNGAPFAPGRDITLAVEGTQSEAASLRQVFTRLSEGGEVLMPLSVQEWGDEFGSLRDRFGKAWNVSISS